MNKNAIKKYAVWARRELISRVRQRAALYEIAEDGYTDAAADSVLGRVMSVTEKQQRQALIARIQKNGYEQVMEEAAYTWFNRFSALRFMEVNGYLPSHVRVFTDDTGAFRPQILTEAINLELDGLDMKKVYALKGANDNETLFKYLIIVQCNALSKILPGMFQKIDDYTELLFPDNLLREGSAVEQMITMIPEEDWRDQVQIIGWLYQYYNTEPKDKVFADLKKNIKVSKENIPAATQLFTPDWIVRYMVENSLGRIFVSSQRLVDSSQSEEERIEHEREIAQQMGWKYYLPEAPQEPEVREQLKQHTLTTNHYPLTTIKVIDPCMGSGHILDYLFDVLMQIYESCGYTPRDAVAGIVQNNLYGLDIDERAAQLAYFSVMMKARQYDRRFFSRGIQPHIYAIQESNGIRQDTVDYFVNGNAARKQAIDTILAELHDAKEYGSILNVTPQDWPALYARFEEIYDDISLLRGQVLTQLLPLVQCAEALAQKYHVVVTNPPYMGSSNMDAALSEYVKHCYPDSKSDLFAVFIERCGEMTVPNGYQAMITQHAWMFLSSFEKLRGKLLQKNTVNMAHLGARAFDEIGGEVVQTTSFVLRKSHVSGYKGTYCRLIEPTTQQGKEDMYLDRDNSYIAKQDDFTRIPGNLIAYQLSNTVFQIFENATTMGNVGNARQGLGTSDNNLFLRLWFEVRWNNIGFGYTGCEDTVDCVEKWFPYIKGGTFRKWYPNKEYVVNYSNDGFDIKSSVMRKYPYLKSPDFVVKNTSTYFHSGITWSDVATGAFSARWVESGYIYADAGPMFFSNNNSKLHLGYMNSPVFQMFAELICQGLHYSTGQIPKIPYVNFNNPNTESQINSFVEENIKKSKADWDSFETSWDFKRCPLV